MKKNCIWRDLKTGWLMLRIFFSWVFIFVYYKRIYLTLISDMRIVYNSLYISTSAIVYCPELSLGERCNQTKLLIYPFFKLKNVYIFRFKHPNPSPLRHDFGGIINSRRPVILRAYAFFLCAYLINN